MEIKLYLKKSSVAGKSTRKQDVRMSKYSRRLHFFQLFVLRAQAIYYHELTIMQIYSVQMPLLNVTCT
jgi:hypothetical protein